MNLQTLAIAAILGYFVGNAQTSLIISRLRFHDDVRKYGSGNAGATNMYRVYGRLGGVATFLGDALKCVIGVLIGRLVGATLGITGDASLDTALGGYMAGLFVTVGHCWPVLFGFRGGKGAAASFAYAWLVFWPGALAMTVAGVGIYLLTHRMSMVSLGCGLIFVILTLIFGAARPYLWIFVCLDVLIVFIRHIDNIRRLIRGEEKPIRE